MGNREYKVGQVLFFASSHRRGMDDFLTVTKVGRKWVSLSYAAGDKSVYKVAIDSTWVDGGAYISPGRLWESKEAYDAYVLVEKEWASLKADLLYRYALAEGVTLEDLTQVRKLLGVPKKK